MARHQKFSRDEALQSAMLLFWEKGFDRTSMEALTQVTAMSRSSIYNTFGSKEGLFMEALAQYASMKSRLREGALAQAPTSCKEQIRCLFYQTIEGLYASSTPDGCLLTESVGNLTEVNLSIRHFIQKQLQEIYQLFLRIIEKGQKTGELNNRTESKELAYLLLNLHESVIVLATIEDDEAKQRQMIDTFLEMI